MAYDGSGNFDRIHNWTADAAANIKIRADRMDAEFDGIATGLSNAICKDGQTTITADIPFGNNKITGLSDPTLAQDAVTKNHLETATRTFTDIQGFANASTGGRTIQIKDKDYGGAGNNGIALSILPNSDGDVFFRPTSAASTLDATKDFYYDNDDDQWKFDDALTIGGQLTANSILKVQDNNVGRFQLHNGTWGGKVASFYATGNGDLIIRPTSAADIDDATKDFWYNNTADRWQFDEVPYVGSSKIWHEGNDGSGSGLNADLLDGAEASAFGKLANDQTWTGKNTFDDPDDNTLFVSTTNGAVDFENANTTKGARISVGGAGDFVITPTVSGAYNTNYDFYFDTADNNWKFGAVTACNVEVNTIDVTLAARQGIQLNGTGYVIAQRPDTASAIVSLWEGWHGNVQTSEIEVNGDFLSATNSYGALSDRTVKREIQDAPPLWDDFKLIKYHSYKLNHEGIDAPERMGVLSDEMESISRFSNIVKKEAFRGHDTVDYSALYVAQGKVLQEAMQRIEELEAKVNGLRR